MQVQAKQAVFRVDEGVVAVFRLPIPSSGFSVISEAIDRLYGTGSMISPVESVRGSDQNGTPPWVGASAPVEGFGPRVTAPMPAPPEDEGAAGAAMAVVGDGLVLSMEESADAVKTLAGAMSTWFHGAGATNYVEARFSTPGEDPEWAVTVRKLNGGRTPHESRMEAEERADAAEARVRQLEKELTRVISMRGTDK